MAILHNVDGTLTPIKPAIGKAFTLAEAQGLVGGYVEAVRSPATRQLLLVDEDGRSKGLAINRVASAAHGIVLVGPVLACERGEFT